MNNDLEFHYIVSYREAYGWQVSIDLGENLMPDGTIYRWNEDGTGEWFFPNNDELETIDLEHYRMLNSALRQMNGE